MSGDIAWVVEAALPPLGPGRLAAVVWIGRDSAATALAPTAQDRHDAARHAPAARPAFLIRRALLRRAVGQAANMPAEGVVAAYDADGRPTLQVPEGTFVSSASRDGWAAVAVAHAPVGVDVEVDRHAAEPALNVLHPRERTRIEALPPAARWGAFLALWTAKEAYLKALGLGLRHEPSLVEVEPGDADNILLRDGGISVAARAASWHAARAGSFRLQAACVVMPSRAPRTNDLVRC